MDFAISPKAEELRERLLDFVTAHVEPATPVYFEQVRESGDPHFHPPVMEDLKAEARKRDLWNLFLPNDRVRRRPEQRRLRAALRDHGPQPADRRGHELRGARHRQHGDPRRVRHRPSRRTSGSSRCSRARSARASR